MRQAQVINEKSKIQVVREYIKMFMDSLTLNEIENSNEHDANMDFLEKVETQRGRIEELEKENRDYEKVMIQHFKKIAGEEQQGSISPKYKVSEEKAREKAKDHIQAIKEQDDLIK